MLYNYLIPALLLFAAGAFGLGRMRATQVAHAHGGVSKLHSLPNHYGILLALTGLLPALLIYGIWVSVETSVLDTRILNELPPSLIAADQNSQSLILNDIKNTLSGNITVNQDAAVEEAAYRYEQIRNSYRSMVAAAILGLLIIGSAVVYRAINKDLRARNIVERIVKTLLLLCSGVAILTTLGIVLSVLFEAIRFFKIIPLQDFLFGLTWSPQMAIRADQTGSSGAFGAIPVFAGTFMIAAIAMLVAIPVGLLAAIYLSEQILEVVSKPQIRFPA